MVPDLIRRLVISSLCSDISVVFGRHKNYRSRFNINDTQRGPDFGGEAFVAKWRSYAND